MQARLRRLPVAELPKRENTKSCYVVFYARADYPFTGKHCATPFYCLLFALILTSLRFVTIGYRFTLRKIIISAALALSLIWCLQSVYAQGSTSKGTEFWTAFMANTNPPGGSNGSVMVLYVTSDQNTTVNVSVADGYTLGDFPVTANQITAIPISSIAYIANAGISKQGIHIVALKPVAVYAHIYADESSGATLLLPVSALGKDYESINFFQASDITPSYSAFDVIATEDTTTVELTIRSFLTNGKPTVKVDTITLKKGEVYQYLSPSDVTGTRIRSISSAAGSCKKLAVFSGSTRVYIGCQLPPFASSDNLFQQAYPVSAWGLNYITIPLKNRNYDIFRVVLSDPATTLTVGGKVISSSAFTNGLYYQFNAQQPTVISADKPIQVAQYAVTQGNTVDCTVDPNDVGDPEMIFLTPLEQTLNQVTLYSASKYEILNDYVNVVIATNASNTFLIDGKHPGFSIVPNTNDSYAYAQLHVSAGTHVLTAGQGFTAIAYGFGQHESFGYAAGANLQDLNSHILLQNLQTSLTQKNGCSGVDYNLQLTLPFETNSIKWDFGNGNVVTQKNPVPAGTTTNGAKTLYIYNYQKNPVNFTKGNYTVTATVFNPVVDECGSQEQVEFDFVISDPPVALFKVDYTAAGGGTTFIDESTSASDIETWSWNFGDGQTDFDENPVHAFAKPGKYKVTLTVTDVDGCTSSYSEVVTINITATAPTGTAAACKGTDGANPNIQQFAISAFDLSGSITATAPPGFQISFNADNGYTNTLNIAQGAGAINNVTIYVRLTATNTIGNTTGNISLTSPGVPGLSVIATGVVNDLPTVDPVKDQTFTGSLTTTPILFTGTSNTYNWTNDNPNIGLPASGSGNIASFKAVNNSSSPIVAHIQVTPLSLTVAYIANANYNKVSAINTVTNTLLASIPVGSYPQGVAVSNDGSKVYVTNLRDGTLSIIDVNTNTLAAPSIKIAANPFGVCVSPDGNWVYVTSIALNEVVFINTSNYLQVPIKVGTSPTGVAVSADGSLLYVANSRSNTVSVINTATFAVVYTIPVGLNPNGLALSPDGTLLYVLNSDSNSVWIINTANQTVASQIPVGNQPFGIAQTIDGGRLYITNSQSNTVSVINTANNKVVATINVGTAPLGVSISPDGTKVYVANQTSNNVSVINTATNTELYRFTSDPGPTSFGNFIVSGTGCTGTPTSFTITVLPEPPPSGIQFTDPAPLATVYANASPSASFNVSGVNLSGVITISAPNNFEVSTDNVTFQNSVTVNPGSGDVKVYVRLAAGINVNSYSGNITMSSPGAANVDAPVSGTVTQAPLTIVADNKVRVFGADNPPLTVTYKGFVNNDNSSELTVKPTVQTSATKASPIGQYPITADGAVSVDYTIDYLPGVLSIQAVPPMLMIPNAFTPNEDGVNDTWDLKNVEDFPNCTVDIFTRYGERIFSSVGYATPWNGKYKGVPLPSGTYYYLIDTKQDGKTLSGSVTIIR